MTPKQPGGRMRVKIEQQKCCGFGNCLLVVPEIFDLDDRRNLAITLVEEVDEALVRNAIKAVDECPTQAISLQEGSDAAGHARESYSDV